MTKGQMPVPYIIAIVIGIIVIGILLYMFVTKTGVFSGFVLESECKAKLKTYCIKWADAGWGPYISFIEYAPECTGLNWEIDQNACRKELGLPTTTIE